MKVKKERDLAKQLLRDEITVDEFLNEDITSENGLMFKNLIQRLINIWDEIPEEYMQFLNDISSASPVTGLLQATKPEALNILNNYCHETLDLRHPQHKDETSFIQSQFPAFWQCLMDIMSLEKSLTFLPSDVSGIVKTLIKIRIETYEKSSTRQPQNYFEYPEEESSTQYYPNWKINRFPSEYNIKSEGSRNLCSKKFNKNAAFTPGKK